MGDQPHQPSTTGTGTLHSHEQNGESPDPLLPNTGAWPGALFPESWSPSNHRAALLGVQHPELGVLLGPGLWPPRGPAGPQTSGRVPQLTLLTGTLPGQDHRAMSGQAAGLGRWAVWGQGLLSIVGMVAATHHEPR